MEIKKIENSQTKFTFTVKKDEFEKALDKAFENANKEIAYPGFRKGKGTRQMYEKNYGIERLFPDALDIILNEKVNEIVKDEKNKDLLNTFVGRFEPLIEEKIESGNLDYPLKAFFGNTNRFGAKRKEPSIVIYDNKVNIDQMRVIYNCMKYPITYVQGPPGTGKTQTILNVVLSAFFNSRTTLICSSNNKPINGILEKLSFSYKEEDDVPFQRHFDRE